MTERIIATYVGSADRLVSKDPSYIYWLTASPATLATQAQLDIYDGFDTGGKKVFRVDTGQAIPIIFNPPIPCNQGIYVDCVDSFDSYTIGYATKEQVKE